jgi:G3E family GTPase
VVVETTGLADPAPILATLMADPRLGLRFVLDGVVTVVDAVAGLATLDAQEEAQRQAAVADRIVLSKTDIADPAQVAALRDRLAALNPVAPVIEARQGAVDPDLLLAAGPFDPAAKAPDVAGWIGAAARGHDHHHHHDPNRHDARIRALCLEFDSPLPWQAVAGYLEMLAMTRGEAVLRVKGVLDIEGEDRPVVVHGVQRVFHPPRRLAAWPAGAPRRSRLVMILRDLDPAGVEAGLRAFLSAAETSGSR